MNELNNVVDTLTKDNIYVIPVADEERLMKFNWAGFFGGTIWCLWHKQYLFALLCFIPFGLIIEQFTTILTGTIIAIVIGLLIGIYLGKHGYRMAWKAYKDKYQSIDKMYANQKSWLRIFLIIYITFAVFILGFTFLTFMEIYNSYNGKIPHEFWTEFLRQLKDYNQGTPPTAY